MLSYTTPTCCNLPLCFACSATLMQLSRCFHADDKGHWLAAVAARAYVSNAVIHCTNVSRLGGLFSLRPTSSFASEAVTPPLAGSVSSPENTSPDHGRRHFFSISREVKGSQMPSFASCSFSSLSSVGKVRRWPQLQTKFTQSGFGGQGDAQPLRWRFRRSSVGRRYE